MRSTELDYDLPPELIAQRPTERRDASRLLVFERRTGAVRHRSFAELRAELDGYLTVVNDTRVVPARLHLRRASGGHVEVLLLELLEPGLWEALARPSRRLRAGEELVAPGWGSPPSRVQLVEALGEGRWTLRLEGEPAGELPLPPYIRGTPEDPERYQTVYARDPGSAAAPTAGLHFTPALVEALSERGVGIAKVTLHVGYGPFQPITAATVEEHRLHEEEFEVTEEAAERISSRKGRLVAVGTTTTRVLETLARGGPLTGRTDLFITPGFTFRRVDALLTNFHLPRTTLLALVMAFAGADVIRELYAVAMRERYRFYSFGDAMLVL